MSSEVSQDKNNHTILSKSIKMLYERILSYQSSLKILINNADEDQISCELPDEIERGLTIEQEIEQMSIGFEKFLKYLNKAFEKVKSFNEAKKKFLEVTKYHC